MLSERVSSLDLLRGAAALTVAVSHFFAHRGTMSTDAEAISATAVEVFFVLSGFVLASQLILCAESRKIRLFWVFLVRRWMRTIPPYIVALGAMVIVSHPVTAGDVMRYGLYVQNFAWQANVNDFFPVAWSLSVEEWFYLSFAGFLLLATRAKAGQGRRTVMVLAIAFVVAISLIRLAFADFAHWGAEVRRITLWRVDAITYGVLLYGLYTAVGRRWFTFAGFAGTVLYASAFAAAAWLSFCLLNRIESADNGLAKHLFPFAAALTGAFAIFTAVRLDQLVSQTLLLRRLASWLGRISYPLYLFHLLVLLLLPRSLGRLDTSLQLAVYIGAVLVLATVVHNAFEVPILAARPPLVAHRRAFASLRAKVA